LVFKPEYFTTLKRLFILIFPLLVKLNNFLLFFVYKYLNFDCEFGSKLKISQMKRNLLTLLIMFFALWAGAQQIKQEVIASAGGYNVASGNTISISWTLGETIIPTFTSQDGSIVLTHGFQQKISVSTLIENLPDRVKVIIYPNPTSEIVNIEFDIPTDAEITLFLLNNQGGLVKTMKIAAGNLNKEINMQDLPSGIYYLRMVKGKLVNVYKVVKL
jgi:hypothetical protein